jgi:exosortase E/protease (VPEID-CTERM system)
MSIAAVAATIFFGWTRVRDELAASGNPVRANPRFWILLSGHLVVFAGFAALTAFLLGQGALRSQSGDAWIAGWLAMGIASFASWCATALFGSDWRRLASRCKFVFLGGLAVGIAAGVAGWRTDRLWHPLSVGTLWIVHQLLQLTGTTLVYDPSIFSVGTSAFHVEIEPACSGYEGIGLVWVFLTVYLWLYRDGLRFPHVLLLFPIGTLLVWLLNAVRIFLLIVIGTWISPELADGGFHSQAGWLAFVALALALVAVAHRAALFSRAPGLALSYPAVAYLTPFLTSIAFGMVTSAFVPGFDYFYPVRVGIIALALWWFRRSYRGLHWSWSWPAFAAGALIAALWVALPAHRIEDKSGDAVRNALRQMPAAGAAAWSVARMIGYVAIVPIAEELAFRGFLLRRLITVDFESIALNRFTRFSLIASSLLFGSLHLTSGRFFEGTLAGLTYGMVLRRRGYLSDCVLAHATTNGLLAICVFATGQWPLLS